MNVNLIELSKIIYCPLSKKYEIVFNTVDDSKEFVIYVSNLYAKKIAISSENIASTLLSQYELFINLLSLLKIEISDIIIKKYNNNLISIINLCDDKKNVMQLNSYVGDALILSFKSFSNIYVEDSLLLNKVEKYHVSHNIDDKIISLDNANNILANSNHFENKIDMLQKALSECISKENYESAAFIRDRIKILNKSK